MTEESVAHILSIPFSSPLCHFIKFCNIFSQLLTKADGIAIAKEVIRDFPTALRDLRLSEIRAVRSAKKCWPHQ